MEDDLHHNKEFLEKRGKEIEDIYRISVQNKELTDNMAQKLNEQGAILDDIEGHITETNDNVQKAHQEIVQADDKSKDNKKKMMCLIIIVFLLIVLIAGIICAIIWGN